MRRVGFLLGSLLLMAAFMVGATGMPRWDNGRKGYVGGEDLTPVASAARTATGNGSALSASAFSAVSLFLNVTAASGTTPTLDVTVEESDDGGSTWRTVGTFAQKTGVSNERKTFLIAADTYRVRWTIGGTTPSFTFAVTGTAKGR